MITSFPVEEACVLFPLGEKFQFDLLSLLAGAMRCGREWGDSFSSATLSLPLVLRALIYESKIVIIPNC